MDQRVSFPSLEGASGEGLALRQVVIGDSPTGKNASIGLAFIDSAGNVVMPQLTATGRLPVDTEGNSGTWSKNRGEVALGSASGTFATVASITLANNDNVDEYNFVVSGRKGGYFQVCLSDNSVITVLDDVVLESGQFSLAAVVKSLVTAGATGTQLLLIRAFNWDTNAQQLSALRASIRALVRGA